MLLQLVDEIKYHAIKQMCVTQTIRQWITLN